MLTSFFGKSNPVNYLILGIFIGLGYIIAIFTGPPIEFSLQNIVAYIFGLGLCVFTMLLVDFIIRKNDLTKPNTFGILFFSCFLIMLPIIFFDRNILLSNAFLLLALRRILSLKSEKNPEKKVLDASLWISIAAFFYVYSLLFFAVLFLAILRKKHTTYKHLLIPFVGFFGVFAIATAYNYVVFGSFNWFFEFDALINFDFSAYNSVALLIPLTILVTLIIWTSIHRLYKLASVAKKDRPNYLLMLIITAAAVLMVLASPQRTGAELLFLVSPLAIIAANYVESISEFWFKEVLLWLVVLLPGILFFLR
ncbi:hypothetical protein ATE92_1043 [Ulvibacter sp. MAR_2010_11]|uniref:DUF6427 family protein n=1 Tax=Ulvibacter sp. MAR_2010_11 TaxID=1250229 RepID=UPI000C2B6BB6|nr:DUF6427 family protein [Ulvibacter sp. MAR_2010_11]PKA82903.1 hypothetical protein ATE92_1043 [Ulvibacter sp. MAR_2010_11]